MRKLAILGASGHGKVVADAAELSGWDEVVFFDDAWPECSSNSVWPVLGTTADLLASLEQFAGVAIAIGNNVIRYEKLQQLREHGAVLPAIIHPQAVISRYAHIGEGSVICAAVAVEFPELKVQMDKPDLTVRTEVRDDGIYLSVETIQASGGLPVGTAGKGMLMLSGGIDSPVAGYLSMKRGIDVEAVHFASPPYTSPQALQKAKDLAAKMARYSGQVPFIEVPFTEIQEQIKKNIPEGYSMTVTRRFMMILTDRIREERKGLAIMNGESLGQVASQTLESMLAINEVTNTPVLRPLVAMDKTEIVKIAQEIDTFELSILPFEDCCTIFTPPRPKTKPNLEKVKEYEKALDVEGLIERAMAGLKIENIGPDSPELNQEEDIFDGLL